MSSPSAPAASERGQLAAVLDLAFGFFVWGVHLLLIYGIAALACVLGLAGGDGRLALRLTLAGVTVAAAALVAGHALLRYRRVRDGADRRFRAWFAIGADALALVAVVWQLFPVLLLPVCA